MRLSLLTNNKIRSANSDGMGNCLLQPGLILNHPKVYEIIFNPTYQTFVTLTNHATVTMSIGLPALAPVVMVFALPSGQFYLDVTNSYHLSGLSHLDNFIVTRKSCPLTGPDSYRDLPKRMPTPTQTAT